MRSLHTSWQSYRTIEHLGKPWLAQQERQDNLHCHLPRDTSVRLLIGFTKLTSNRDWGSKLQTMKETTSSAIRSKQAQRYRDCTRAMLHISIPRVTYHPQDEPDILVSTIQRFEISYHSKQMKSVMRGLQSQDVKVGFYQVKLSGESSAAGKACFALSRDVYLRVERAF